MYNYVPADLWNLQVAGMSSILYPSRINGYVFNIKPTDAGLKSLYLRVLNPLPIKYISLSTYLGFAKRPLLTVYFI